MPATSLHKGKPKNSLKHKKGKRFYGTDSGFSIGTWKSRNTQEMREICFSRQIAQSAFTDCLLITW